MICGLHLLYYILNNASENTVLITGIQNEVLMHDHKYSKNYLYSSTAPYNIVSIV